MKIIKVLFSYAHRVYRIYKTNNLAESAAGLSYYMVFSFFPFLMVVYATLSLFRFNSNDLENLIKVIIPSEISLLLQNFFIHLEKQSGVSFLIIGIILTIYTMTRYVKVFEGRIHAIYGSKERSGFKSWCLALLFSQLLLIAFYVTVFVIVMGENILNYISEYFYINKVFSELYLFFRFFICAAIVFFVILLLYYIMPAVKQKLRDVLPGASAVLLFWVLTSVFFSFYMNNISNYSLIYDSIGAFMMLLLWLYFTNLILLSGVLINGFFYKKRLEKSALETKNLKFKKFNK